MFYTASAQAPERKLKLFAEAVASSNRPGADLFRDVTPETWEVALRRHHTDGPFAGFASGSG